MADNRLLFKSMAGEVGAVKGAHNILLVPGRDRRWITGAVRAALEKVMPAAQGNTLVDELLRRLEAGQAQQVQKLTDHFRKGGGLDATQRLLLNTPGIYARIVDGALPRDGHAPVDIGDTVSFASFVLRELERDDGPRHRFAQELLQVVLEKRGIRLPEALADAAVAELRRRSFPADADRIELEVNRVVEAVRENGPLATYVNLYLRTAGDLDESLVSDEVRRGMVEYLRPLAVKWSEDSVTGGELDEYFAAAYAHAARAGSGATSDPIDSVRQKGSVSDWDFTVDAFESIDEQGIIRENILAAGALDYVYTLGELLGIYRLADAVVLRWASGQIDLQPGDTPSRLYRYWKLRAERMQPEERAMLYRRVLAKGDGELLDGMVENAAFPELWGGLMERVADYIARVEEKKTEEYSVSRQSIYQATKQLQYNLTEFMTGMAHLQVTEMYHQLQEAKGILEDPQIVDFFGNGRRRTLWTVIERGHKEWFGEAPNIAAIRSLAMEGNKVFQWIAAFDQGATTDAEFEAFREAAEAWIIAQASVGGVVPVPAGTPAGDGGAPGAGDDFDSDWNK